MGFSSTVERAFRWLLPSPFTIAVLLTLLTYILALWATPEPVSWNKAGALLNFWDEGLWNNALLVFAVQMMLMLVLGHVLALTEPFDRLIRRVTRYCTTTASAAAWVTLLTVAVGLFNWGFALIFGAIFARKVGEQALTGRYEINYPLVGAAGYSGLLVWHGGLSGSSLTKVAEPGHLASLMTGILPEAELTALPSSITFAETVFSPMNLTVSLLLLIALPMTMWMLGKRVSSQPIQLKSQMSIDPSEERPIGAEVLDRSRWFSLSIGLVILAYVIQKAWTMPSGLLAFFTPNNINLLLLGLSLAFHSSFRGFLSAVEEAIGGVSGILIQFPLYFGIMGIMKSSGLVGQISAYFVQISTDATYPIFTFFSAGLVNIFVPSGGGQWAIQGPIIVQAADHLGVSLSKCILAMAYGDQLTNMLQPFWALPLLGITGLKAREILPYTVVLMLVATLIFTTALFLF
jgi:short-chain fatty acids transporter